MADSLESLPDWIIQQGIEGASFESLLEALCQRLLAAGLPILRMNLSMRAQHPSVGAFAHRWTRDGGMMREEYLRNTTAEYGWDQSPLKALVDSPGTEVDFRIDPDERPFRFPIFEELLEMGATEYFAQQLLISETGVHINTLGARTVGVLVSWTMDGDGLSEAQRAHLRAMLPALGLALKSMSNAMTARDLLSVYLGSDAGQRVMSGDILRGSVETIRTAILYFDLQGFTKLSEALPPETLVDMLNDYFAEVVRIVEAREGQVLKFMGDGVLAIFRQKGDGTGRLAAIDAVAEIRDEMERVNARRAAADLPTTSFNAAVHSGEVLYGNIGGATRLDFTVIGPAVNAAARILGMCSALDQQILVSAIAAERALEVRPALVSVGQYRLRGVADRMELFTLD